METEVLERLRARIVCFAAAQIGKWGAEDVAQEVLLVLHEKYPALERAEDLVPVALKIARFAIWAARRKARRRSEDGGVAVGDLPLPDEGPSPYDLAERSQRLELLEAALLSLGERCRELFRLKLEGYTFADIRARLGVESLNTLYTWDFRCRKQLLAKLAEMEAPKREKSAAKAGCG